MASQDEQKFPSLPYAKLLPRLPLDKDGFVHSFDLIDEKESNEMQTFFAKYGLVVIRNLLTPKAADKSRDELYEFLEDTFRDIDGGPKGGAVCGLTSKLGIVAGVPVLSEQFYENRQNPAIYKACFAEEHAFCKIDPASKKIKCVQ